VVDDFSNQLDGDTTDGTEHEPSSNAREMSSSSTFSWKKKIVNC